MAIDPSVAFDMVNHTKLISALTLSPVSSNTKRWLSADFKGRTACCHYNVTLSPSSPFIVMKASLRVLVIPYPIQLICLHIPLIRQPSYQLLCR